MLQTEPTNPLLDKQKNPDHLDVKLVLFGGQSLTQGAMCLAVPWAASSTVSSCPCYRPLPCVPRSPVARAAGPALQREGHRFQWEPCCL